MSPISVLNKPSPVYNRIAQNRRQTFVLMVLAIALALPFVAALSYGVSEVIIAQTSLRARLTQSSAASMERELARHRASGYSATAAGAREDRQLELRLRKTQAEMAEDEEALGSLRLRIMAIVAAGVSTLLGLLFWSVSSSPTSRILSMCGARPAGAAETDARRLLENLAVTAGLPVPKLFVIDSGAPNAFAAGTDPSNSVIAVTQGMLRLLDRRELEGVFAHELSHIGNRDTRLNTVVAALALFLRLPYLMLKRRFEPASQLYDAGPRRKTRWMRYLLTFTMIPAIVYVFVIAPVLGALIRAVIARGREFLVDADAAGLTRNPEGLLRALAKIAGAGSVVAGSNPVISHLYFADPVTPGGAVGLFRGSLLATHPPIEQRVSRLMAFDGTVPSAIVEEAVREGAEFNRYHPPTEPVTVSETITKDELSVFTAGNPMGRVFQVMTQTSIYDRPDVRSFIVARVRPGDLIVVFDDPGRFRQVLTHNQTFGYMPTSVKIRRVDMLPSEIHDPAARASIQNSPQNLRLIAPRRQNALTFKHFAIAAILGLTVFAAILLMMLVFGGN